MSPYKENFNGAHGKNVSSVRQQALEVLYQVNTKGAYANLALDKKLEGSSLALADRNLVTELVNGTVRMQKHLDWVLALFLKTGLNKQNPWLLNILRMSAYQILFMERIPAYACVNEAVVLTQTKVSDSMGKVTNAVLRRLIREKDHLPYPPDDTSDYLAVYYSHPQWMADKLLEQYGWQETIRIMKYNNQRPPLQIRTNLLKIDREGLINSLSVEGAVCSSSAFNPWSIDIESLPRAISELEAYRKGYFYVQNSASMLSAPILRPEPGHTVFDLCAGLGGKTTQLAEWMDNQGMISAFDLYARKLELLKQNSARMGISIIRTENRDVTTIDGGWGTADRVLLDAPCSGLGVLNRRADSRWHKKPQDLTQLLETQRNLLRQAGKLLKKDGRLLYSTCTFLEEENQQQILDFLDKNPGFELMPFAEYLSSMPLDGEEKNAADQGMLSIAPGKYGTDGMFYALLRRIRD